MTQKALSFIQKAKASGQWGAMLGAVRQGYANGGDVDDLAESNLKGALFFIDRSVEPFDEDFIAILGALKGEVFPDSNNAGANPWRDGTGTGPWSDGSEKHTGWY